MNDRLNIFKNLIAVFALSFSVFHMPQAAFSFSYEDPTLMAQAKPCSEPYGKEIFVERDPDLKKGDLCVSAEYLDKAHHFALSWKAARKKGFSDAAAFSVAYHADMIDLFGYSPITYLQGLDRVRPHYAIQVDLIKNMHFDDLYSTPAVECAWKRYMYRTFAGLLWAAEKNDVAAAHLLLGVSFHALEDFYSHSIWVNEPARRNLTWFETSPEMRKNWTLWTGAYEHPEQHGIKHHGKIKFSCAVYNNLPKVVLDLIKTIGCHALSPSSGNDESFCNDIKACSEGKSLTTTLGHDFDLTKEGISLPDDVLFTEEGINLDAKWFAQNSVKTRGIELSGVEAFQTAYDLAQRTAEEWLDVLDDWMGKAGYASFWETVKKNGESEKIRESEWIDFNKFPFIFPMAGTYPHNVPGTCNGEAGSEYEEVHPYFNTAKFKSEQQSRGTSGQDVYLLVRLKTANELLAGTDAKIILKAAGQEFLLDYFPSTVSFYNDFEAGDDTVYWVGPLPYMPQQLTLENRVSGAGDIALQFAHNVAAFMENLWNDALKPALYAVVAGGNDDVVSKEHKTFTVRELVNEPVKNVQFDLDGEKLGQPSMGRYLLDAVIKTRVEDGQAKVRVSFTRLECKKESEWDRATDSDEPYFHAILAPLPGEVRGVVSPVFETSDPGHDGFDTGDVLENTGVSFEEVSLPLNGILGLTVVEMENDFEDASDREETLRKYVTGVEEKAQTVIVGFMEFLGADWKLEDMEIYAFNNAQPDLYAGTVLSSSDPQTAPQWIAGSQSKTFTLKVPKTWKLDALRAPGFIPPEKSPLKTVRVVQEQNNKVVLEVTYGSKPKGMAEWIFAGVYPVDSQGKKISGASFKFMPFRIFSLTEGKESNGTVEILYGGGSAPVTSSFLRVILYEGDKEPDSTRTYDYAYPHTWTP